MGLLLSCGGTPEHVELPVCQGGDTFATRRASMLGYSFDVETCGWATVVLHARNEAVLQVWFALDEGVRLPATPLSVELAVSRGLHAELAVFDELEADTGEIGSEYAYFTCSTYYTGVARRLAQNVREAVRFPA